MFKNAILHNKKRRRAGKLDIVTYKNLNSSYFFKVKVYRNLLKKVFKMKPSKKMNKICFFFFNRKKRRINTN